MYLSYLGLPLHVSSAHQCEINRGDRTCGTFDRHQARLLRAWRRHGRRLPSADECRWHTSPIRRTPYKYVALIDLISHFKRMKSWIHDASLRTGEKKMRQSLSLPSLSLPLGNETPTTRAPVISCSRSNETPVHQLHWNATCLSEMAITFSSPRCRGTR